jgi:hypothetical protein
MNSSRWIMLILVLQAMILLGQWVGQPTLPRAEAQIPDAGAQRNQIIDGIKTTNDKLDHLITLFESGEVHVKTVPATPEKSH